MLYVKNKDIKMQQIILLDVSIVTTEQRLDRLGGK